MLFANYARVIIVSILAISGPRFELFGAAEHLNATMKLQKSKATLLVAGALVFSAGAASAQLGDILKIGGTALIVRQFGSTINKVLNNVTGQNKLEDQGIVTKVVPVLSAGSRGAIGIVQVAGPRDQVDKVRAVAQLQTQVKALSTLQARILIPIDADNLKNINRVSGVGVSAIVDIKL